MIEKIAYAKSNRVDTISSLRNDIDLTVGALFAGDVSRIALVDPPNHANVGDQAILLGEHAFLGRHAPKAQVDFVDIANYSARVDPIIESADVILIHGGGNFGDLWPRHHDLRKRILERFAHKRIVQLPQSMSFSSPTELAETARLIKRCSAFTLCLRDKKSLANAESNFDCETILSPDMAFAMDDINREQSVVDCFALLRTDKEVLADHDAVIEKLKQTEMSLIVGDWLSEPNSLVKRTDYVAGRLTRRFPGLLNVFGKATSEIRISYARASLARGIKLLSLGEVVVSDRLHAHVISCLLGIPNIVMDSLDGKVSALYAAWTHRFAYSSLSAPEEVANVCAQMRITR